MSCPSKFNRDSRKYDEAQPGDDLNEEPESTTGKFDEGDCAFCFVSPQVAKSFPACGHTFCLNCLNKWSKIKMECPTCKQEIRFIDCNNWRKTFYIASNKLATDEQRSSNRDVWSIVPTTNRNSKQY